MKEIIISENIRSLCPEFTGAAVYAEITNSPHNDELWGIIDNFSSEYSRTLTTESIKHHPAIDATRQAYKRCGKEPSRYRPSAESLIRRILKGQELYHVDTAVDLINLASIRYGYSIGGFDYDKICGDTITLGIGEKDEPYEGIGRGMLNIECMPVYRDALSGIGTPTSDNERTKLSLDTKRLLCIVNGYDGNASQVQACAEYIAALLKQFADAKSVAIRSF